MDIGFPFVMVYDQLLTAPYLQQADVGPLSVVYPPTESESLYLLLLTLTYLLP